MALPDLRSLLQALVEEPAEFVVIGGLAVAAHGFLRTTEDLDLVPNPDHHNLDRMVNALIRLDARLTLAPERGPGPEERQGLYRGRNLSLSTRAGDVDLVQRLPGVPAYTDLASRATIARPFGFELAIASRDDLLAMKRARGSTMDLADIERLTEPDGN